MSSKPSEKFWNIILKITYIVSIIFSVIFTNELIDSNKDIKVPVTVTGKYAQGYHGKYSVGEKFYVNCNSKDYGSLTIKVNFKTYNNLNDGDKTCFTLSKNYITKYDNLTVLSYICKVTFVLVITVITLFFIGDRIVYLIGSFNKYIDKKFTK